MKLNPIASNMNEVVFGSIVPRPLSDFPSEVTVLFSYKTPVAVHVSGVGAFKTNCKWSSTTSRHINKWANLHGFSNLVGIEQVVIDNLLNEVK